MAGKLMRLMFTLLLTAVIGWLTIWPSTPAPIQAQPLAGPEAPAGGQEVREDDLLDQVLTAGVLVVATDANYEPFSWVNEYNELVGFDVDVAKEVADRLGVAVEFELPQWDDVVAGDWGAVWDVSIGSMTPTDDRALVLWFTDPYYYYPAFFAVHNDNTTFTEPADLAGAKVGVGTMTTYEDYLNGELDLGGYGWVLSYWPPPDVDVVAYAYDSLALADLAVGDGVHLDAVLTSQFTIHGAIEDGAPLKYLGDSVFSEPVVFALDQARGPSDLMIAELNRIIAEMRGDGTLTSFSMTWLGIDVTSPGEVWWEDQVFLPLVVH